MAHRYPNALIVLLTLAAGCDAQHQAGAPLGSEKRTQVVVPRKDIGAGTVIKMANMAVRAFHRADLPQGYVASSDFKSVEHRATNRSLAGGVPLTYDAVSELAMHAEIKLLDEQIEERRKAIEELAGCAQRCEAKFTELVSRLGRSGADETASD